MPSVRLALHFLWQGCPSRVILEEMVRLEARMTHIRWGILGASKFAREHMGPAIHAAKGAVLSAVASRTPDSVAPFQEFAAGCRAIEAMRL